MASNLIVARGGVEFVPPISLAFWRWTTVFVLLIPFFYKPILIKIKSFKKDVLTKIHGGGATDRKRKLLEKQKKGKARSKQFGRVEIPQEAFIGVLKINNDK